MAGVENGFRVIDAATFREVRSFIAYLPSQHEFVVSSSIPQELLPVAIALEQEYIDSMNGETSPPVPPSLEQLVRLSTLSPEHVSDYVQMRLATLRDLEGWSDLYKDEYLQYGYTRESIRQTIEFLEEYIGNNHTIQLPMNL